MATAEELLAASATQQSDDTLVIDGDLRTVTIPAGYEVLGVESDDNVNRVQFRGPRYYHDSDLSTFEIRVNIKNANGDLDIFPVMDMNVEDGSDTITFSWLVGRYTAQYKGNVTFSLCFREVDSQGVITREYNTTTVTGKILEGLEVGELIIQQNPDVLETILSRLESLENGEQTSIELDTTLTVSGAAADAKTVGDRLASSEVKTFSSITITENADGSVTMENTFTDGTSETIILAAGDKPGSVTHNGAAIPIEWVTAADEVTEVSE